MKFEIELSGPSGKTKHLVDLQRSADGSASLSIDGQQLSVDAALISPNTFSVLLSGQAFELHITPSPDGTLKLQCGPHEYAAQVSDPRAWRGRKQGHVEVEGRQEVLAPMPGKIVRILVQAGDAVEAGQGLLVVEAMKMQNEIRSPKSGKVERLLAKEGQNVNAGEVLAWVE